MKLDFLFILLQPSWESASVILTLLVPEDWPLIDFKTSVNLRTVYGFRQKCDLSNYRQHRLVCGTNSR